MIRAITRRLPFAPVVFYKVMIIGGLLMAEVMVGRMATRMPPPVLLALIAAPPIVLLALGKIEYGILAIMLAAAAVRVSIPTGTYSRIVASLVLTAVFIVIWIAKMLVVEKKLYLKPMPTNVPLLGFIAATVVSYVWSNAFRDPLVMVWSSWPFVQLGGLAVMVLLPGVFLLVSNCLTELKWIKRLAGIILLVGTVVIIGDFLRHPLHFLQVRPLFPTWFVCLAYSQALFNRRLSPWVRLLLLVLTGAWLFRVVIRQIWWVSAWLPTMTAVFIISSLRSRWILLFLILLVVLFGLLNLDYLEAQFERESQASGYTRLAAWEHNWRITSKHWLFGVGPAGYAVYYMSYFPAEAMATHSNYIDILSQTGVVGTFFFLWFFFALFKIGFKLVKQTRKRHDFVEGFSVAALGGYGGTIVAMGLADWITPFVYTQAIKGFDYASYTWMLLGAMVSLAHLYREQA